MRAVLTQGVEPEGVLVLWGCDDCGEVRFSPSVTKLPEGWEESRLEATRGHLCPSCVMSYIDESLQDEDA